MRDPVYSEIALMKAKNTEQIVQPYKPGLVKQWKINDYDCTPLVVFMGQVT